MEQSPAPGTRVASKWLQDRRLLVDDRCMARLSFPTAFLAEFRGVEAASSFPNRETGETVHRPATLKLERAMPNGDVLPVEVPLRQEVALGFHVDDLKRGELVSVVGEVNVWSGRNGGGYFLSVGTIDRVSKNGEHTKA